MDKKKKLRIAGWLLLISAAATAYFYTFVYLKWNIPLYGISMALIFLEGAAAFALLAKAKDKPVKGVLLSALPGGAIAIGGVFIFSFIVNVLIYREGGAAQASAATAVFGFVFALFCAIRFEKLMKDSTLWKKLLSVLLCVCVFCCAFLPVLPTLRHYAWRNSNRRVADPTGLSTYTKKESAAVTNADLYVAPDGSDENDGTLDNPLATIEKARDLVRAMDRTGRNGITVALKAGEYRVSSLVFTREDGGTKDCPVTYCAYGDGEVILNGGVTLPRDAFTGPTGDIAGRLPADAKERVISVDLSALNVTRDQYGGLYAIGSYNMANKYDGDWTGDLYCELFIDDQRQTIARYPNGTQYLYTGKVISEGKGNDSYMSSWLDPEHLLRNPESDVYKMDKALSERIKSWKTTDGVWMFGYFSNDWADASTPIGAVDHENLTISPAFAAMFGAKEKAPYYFFNVPEELDAPGEWYLDRDNGVLYFYPPEDFSENSTVELSLSTDNIIKADADFLTFDGFTVKGTRGDAVNVTGNGNTVRNCLIKNVAGNALLVTGYDNLITDNEITRTGKGGVILDGGDRETLAHSNNRAENNLVHDWSEIYETYQPAFTLNGVGNICSHNEMYNSPHEAVTYSGNDHMIEYNIIHDVNLKTDDGGAIYSGRRWDWYGTVIRCNLIYDLGADGHRPVGIYMDDAIAGQTIYGNIIINVPKYGLQLGGGQDLIAHDNIVINSYEPVSFDARALSGLSGNESSSFYQEYKEGGRIWQLLYDSPWQSPAWQTAYPQYKRYSDDFSNTDDPDFVLNPAHNSVTHNIFISPEGTIGWVADEVYQYSEIRDNAVFKLSALKKIFVDPENGDYTVRPDAPIDFEIDVPKMSEFGRQ